MTIKKFILFILTIVLASSYTIGQNAYQYIKEGDKAFTDADYYTAFYYFNKARETDSNTLEATYKLAECCRLINDYKNAYKYYSNVLAIDKYKEFPLSEFWMGIISKNLENYESSKNHLQRFYDRYSLGDYFKKKAIQEINANKWIIDNIDNQENINIMNMGENINTKFSEFAATQFNDSFYQYSSIREIGSSLKNKNKEFLSQIYTLKIDNDKWKENKELFSWLDKFNQNIANGSFSEDGLRFYFNVCEYKNISELRCDIYMSENKNNSWQEPIKLNEDINQKNYTNTQPTEAKNKTLYFSSDRANGEGKLDIWYCERNNDGSYSSVKNLGKNINSVDNEITPFFDSKNNRLYFSSNWYEGYGGYDVFYSEQKNNQFNSPINLKKPINSSTNDVYFNINKNDPTTAYISSNRTGSLFLKGENCCNDIYKVSIKTATKNIDTISIATIKTSDTNNISTIRVNTNDTPSTSVTTKSKLEQLLPVTVYFHNDIPNPRSTSDTTILNYLSTYNEYTQMKNEYIIEYSKVENTNPIREINELFDKYVDEGYRKLLFFSTIMKDALLANKTVQLTIEGYCSPLALNDYNIHLANRRIASLKNYIKEFDNGFYVTYLNNGQLKIVNAPFGEEKAKSGISDDRLDTKNSVYNPNAAIERRVAIIAIDIK
jgi:hypothetical protein